MGNKLYKDYFNIDPKYYAAVTKDLIDSGKVSWKNFYPHETFLKLLKKTHDVLSGKDPRSLWVDGAYGTGKSHAALTVKSIIDATDEDVRAYFEDYGLSNDLCQKLITDKNAGTILTVHRIGSSSIHSDRDLILAVQDSITATLKDRGLENQGEASLRDAALGWFEKEANRRYFDSLISEEKYAWTFGGQKVDSIVKQLRSGDSAQVTELMRNIIAVAEDNGVTALRMDIPMLANWVKSVIEGNHLKAVLFVWDEFTEYFDNNMNSLTGFQTLAEISLSHPFYFLLIAHLESDARKLQFKTSGARDALGKIKDRFAPTISIELPENMAFQLMAQAMKITSDSFLSKEWGMYKGELNEDLAEVRASIRDSFRKRTTMGKKTVITDQELQNVVPIHPFAALILKYLSEAFTSNQRSMFDFIINNDEDMKAFKWFISHYGPLTANNLITVDMLWDFFYGKEQSNMADDVRVILDSYYLLNSDRLGEDKERVLKAMLLLQAISLRVPDVELLRPNERNIELAFGGLWQIGKGRGLANQLVDDGLLFKRLVGGGKTEFTVANSTGDAETIRKKKAEVLANTKTQDLIVQADLLNAVQLPAAIAGRYVLQAAASTNFTFQLNKLNGQYAPNRIKALVTFALNDQEAEKLKGQIINVLRTGKDSLLIIDAGLTPMGSDLFDQYVENMAFSSYYAQSDKARAGEFQKKAERNLTEWKNHIGGGAFMLYDAEHLNGMRMGDLNALQNELSAINHRQYPYGLEQFSLIANMFMKGPLAQGAECGITQTQKGTFRAPNQRNSIATALDGAWGVERYWEDPVKQGLPIVKIKKKVEELVSDGFAQRAGKVCMSAIYSALTEAPFGFMPNNISAFVLGFVLKEYANGDFIWSNGTNSETMTVDKMKLMIANAINQTVSPAKNFHEEFIGSMTAEHRAFLKCTASVFQIPEKQCGSIEIARDQLRIRMQKLSFPIWCVKYVLPKLEHVAGTDLISNTIDQYLSIANTANGNKESESELATSIGQRIMDNPSLPGDLARVLTDDNCRSGMLAYLDQFQDGLLRRLAETIGDNGAYLKQVKMRFNADAANWVWNPETADDRIRDVILDYQIIVESNKSLPKCLSIDDVVHGWNAKTNHVRISYEAVKRSVGDLARFLDELRTMKQSRDLPDQRRKKFYGLLLEQREAFERFYANQIDTFKLVAASFLRDLDESDIDELYAKIPSGQFTKSSTEYFRYIEKEVSDFMKGQLKKRISDLWLEKTGTKSPEDWSNRYDTPILCMFDDASRSEAKEIFSIMRESNPSEDRANRVLRYLTNATFYSSLESQSERDQCFMKRVVGDYAILLRDIRAVRKELSRSRDGAYYWMDNSAIQNRLKIFAEKQYKTGGYERVQSVIDRMDAGELREYLKNLICDNVIVGIEILKNE